MHAHTCTHTWHCEREKYCLQISVLRVATWYRRSCLDHNRVKRFLNIFILCVYVCMYVFMCMHVHIYACGGQKGMSELPDRWLWAAQHRCWEPNSVFEPSQPPSPLSKSFGVWKEALNLLTSSRRTGHGDFKMQRRKRGRGRLQAETSQVKPSRALWAAIRYNV